MKSRSLKRRPTRRRAEIENRPTSKQQIGKIRREGSLQAGVKLWKNLAMTAGQQIAASDDDGVGRIIDQRALL